MLKLSGGVGSAAGAAVWANAWPAKTSDATKTDLAKLTDFMESPEGKVLMFGTWRLMPSRKVAKARNFLAHTVPKNDISAEDVRRSAGCRVVKTVRIVAAQACMNLKRTKKEQFHATIGTVMG